MEYQEVETVPFPEVESVQVRAKTSVRLQYEAQVEVIRKQIGDLEQIREKLGLSQRKIAQLLMVDPSAWTRWTKKGETAPPHIFRALQWYLILNEKLPGLTPQYFTGKDPELLHQTALQHIRVESEKRLEFEDAMAIQSLRLEKQLLELESVNRQLSVSKSSLEVEIRQLRSATWHNRIGFFFLAVGGMIFAMGVYFRFLRS